MIQFTQKKPDKCAEVLLSHEVQISLTCGTKWMYHLRGRYLTERMIIWSQYIFMAA